jgi:hypothetical protein
MRISLRSTCPHPRRALIRSATVSTILLESWASLEMDGFDLAFLAIRAMISAASSAVVLAIGRSFRRSRRIVMETPR